MKWEERHRKAFEVVMEKLKLAIGGGGKGYYGLLTHAGEVQRPETRG
jgi:hypothetical protein